jgi:hypothetical protein
VLGTRQEFPALRQIPAPILEDLSEQDLDAPGTLSERTGESGLGRLDIGTPGDRDVDETMSMELYTDVDENDLDEDVSISVLEEKSLIS